MSDNDQHINPLQGFTKDELEAMAGEAAVAIGQFCTPEGEDRTVARLAVLMATAHAMVRANVPCMHCQMQFHMAAAQLSGCMSIMPGGKVH